MVKTELVGQVAQQAGLSERQASECVASFVEQITNALARGEQVRLFEFGSFSIRHASSRRGRNPRTGDVMTVKAHNLARFKPAKILKSAVNPGPSHV